MVRAVKNYANSLLETGVYKNIPLKTLGNEGNLRASVLLFHYSAKGSIPSHTIWR